MTLLWPRLLNGAARVRLSEIDRNNPQSAVALAHRTQVFASTGGVRASEHHLEKVRADIVDVASRFGFPGSAHDAIGFDRAAAPAVYAAMPMPIAEAATKAVWNFVSLVLAPDVTAWRFGFANEERWICSDRTRHMFSRLWWQEHLLGGTDDRLLDGLTERDLNQLLERTSIGGCRPLLHSLAREVLRLHPVARGRDVVGDAALRLLRYMSFIDFHSLSSEQIDLLVQETVSECVRIHVPGAVTGRTLPPPDGQ